MNIYFLVEGRSTEKKIYPKWLEYLIPELERVDYHDQAIKNNYYIISGRGYPNILYDGLDNAINKINETNNYDYLVICVDVDEDTVDERVIYIQNFIKDRNINLGGTEIIIIAQNRCIETWLLGNRKIFDSRQPQEYPLSDYVSYYDVSQNDPELMGQYNMKNHADFHFEYLREIFIAKNIIYTKKRPGEAQKQYYLDELKRRVTNNPDHLKSFQTFLEFCKKMKREM
ncbi:hypothetical protein [Lyngbya sp. CCY1209]|uniref:hypothetical protein n=1 Tax=Lyngbya sp. CCY1209 TaxID=2886103 RepID=UPI002D20BCAC|nr:hypothetical protein [Lyngbya sp. CCY1209]MEB3884515.1 hypothetical protein [Lyngbya sp. CCY1209]